MPVTISPAAFFLCCKQRRIIIILNVYVVRPPDLARNKPQAKLPKFPDVYVNRPV